MDSIFRRAFNTLKDPVMLVGTEVRSLLVAGTYGKMSTILTRNIDMSLLEEGTL